MTIYISLPISGHAIERCKERAEAARQMVLRRGHDCVTPFDVCPDQSDEHGTPLRYSYFIGRDIEALLECDAIFLLTGWSTSSGCQCEWRCAEIFNKKIYQHISEIPCLHGGERTWKTYSSVAVD